MYLDVAQWTMSAVYIKLANTYLDNVSAIIIVRQVKDVIFALAINNKCMHNLLKILNNDRICFRVTFWAFANPSNISQAKLRNCLNQSP